jgi:hypothetical protein
MPQVAPERVELTALRFVIVTKGFVLASESLDGILERVDLILLILDHINNNAEMLKEIFE